MRKLLLLLPLMAVASCSGGHDLMSNGAFQMTCVTPGKGGGETIATLTASPELPQATIQVDDEPASSVNVLAVSPLEIRIEVDRNQYITDVAVINRQSAEVRVITTSTLDGEIVGDEGEPLEGCTFKSL